ncbi:MAG: CPBP family glutamic-type intramembrane protease [Planctomycetota bacterium]|jgi:membrane protease YdiL (CAAX protease family)
MDRLFNIIAETLPDESGAASATLESFWDPTSIILCTAGLCILVIWRVWYGGFGALKKAPTRRHHWWLVFWPLSILFFWLFSIAVILEVIAAFMDLDAQSLSDTIRYPVRAVLQIGLIAGMLMIARKTFARGLNGFGLKPAFLIKDTPLAIMHLLAVFPLITTGLWITLAIGRLFKGAEFNLEVHQSLDLLTDAGIGMQALITIFAALIVPVFEELLFRGFLQTSLRSVSGKPWAAIVITSLFFSILHPPTHIPALFLLSCGMGYAYERSGSLFRPILMHIFFNGFNVVVAIWQSS